MLYPDLLDVFFSSQHLYKKLPFCFIFNSLLCISYFHIHNPAEPMPSVLSFLLSCVGCWNLCQNSKVGGSWRSAQLYFMTEGRNFAWYFKLFVLWQISQHCMCKTTRLDVHWSLVFDSRCGLREALLWPLYQPANASKFWNVKIFFNVSSLKKTLWRKGGYSHFKWEGLPNAKMFYCC